MVIEPKRGQIWKYPSSEDLYVISVVDFASSLYWVLVDINTGYVGPIWENPEEMIADLVYVSENIEQLLLEKGEEPCV